MTLCLIFYIIRNSSNERKEIRRILLSCGMTFCALEEYAETLFGESPKAPNEFKFLLSHENIVKNKIKCKILKKLRYR
jgi:hypothetical protein